MLEGYTGGYSTSIGSSYSSESLSSTRFDMQAITNTHIAEKVLLRKERDASRKENTELQEELDEARALIEVLRSQVDGSQSLVHQDALSNSPT